MAVGEGEVRQAGCDGGQAGGEPDPVADSEPAEHQQQQRDRAELDHECERGEVPDGAEQDELQGPGLEHRVGEGARPGPREQLLAPVDEVDEVAGIRPSIEGGHTGGRRQDGHPDAGDRGAQKVPHLGRYRPSEG